MTVCLLSWTFHDCLFVKLDISWLFVCLTGLCYDFGGQKMATRWRWHRFKIKNMNFRYFLVYFDEFLPNFRWFLPIFCWSLPNFWWLLPNFRWLLPNFWWFLPILAKFSMIFGISCAHLGTVAQCSVDPQCASSAKTKHLETSQKLSETLKKNHETSRK